MVRELSCNGADGIVGDHHGLAHSMPHPMFQPRGRHAWITAVAALGAIAWSAAFVTHPSAHLVLVAEALGAVLAVAGAAAFVSLARRWPPGTAAVAALGVVLAVHLLFLAAVYPGLIISDALHVDWMSRRGVIDDFYGYLWPLMLSAARRVSPHAVTASLMQLAYFMALLAYLGIGLRRAGASAATRVIAILATGLFPMLIASATYQHRDAFAAMLALHWALFTLFNGQVLASADGPPLRRALLIESALLFLLALARPELTLMAVIVLAALAVARYRHRAGPAGTRLCIVAAVAVPVLVAIYTFAITHLVTVERRPVPYLTTLLIQPVGYILSQRPGPVLHPGALEAFDKVFESGKLAELYTPKNIPILYSPYLKPATREEHAEFARHALWLIEDNLPEALANRVTVYLHGNGLGHLGEPAQDQAQNPRFAEVSGFEPAAPRPASLAFVGDLLYRSYGGEAFSWPRAIVWDSLPFVLLAFAVLAWGRPGSGSWLVALGIGLRAASLFVGAPGPQYAYHMPVVTMGLALVVGLLALPSSKGT